MKNSKILIIAAVVITTLGSCEKESEKLITKNVSVSMGASYVNDIYYRMSDGMITPLMR